MSLDVKELFDEFSLIAVLLSDDELSFDDELFTMLKFWFIRERESFFCARLLVDVDVSPEVEVLLEEPPSVSDLELLLSF